MELLLPDFWSRPKTCQELQGGVGGREGAELWLVIVLLLLPGLPSPGPSSGCLSTTWVSGEGTELGLGSAEPLHPLASGKCLQPRARSFWNGPCHSPAVLCCKIHPELRPGRSGPDEGHGQEL